MLWGAPSTFNSVLNFTMEKLPMLTYFGTITIADVMKAKSASEYERFVMDWAKCVWGAHAIYHQLAREWVRAVKEFGAIVKLLNFCNLRIISHR